MYHKVISYSPKCALIFPHRVGSPKWRQNPLLQRFRIICANCRILVLQLHQPWICSRTMEYDILWLILFPSFCPTNNMLRALPPTAFRVSVAEDGITEVDKGCWWQQIYCTHLVQASFNVRKWAFCHPLSCHQNTFILFLPEATFVELSILGGKCDQQDKSILLDLASIISLELCCNWYGGGNVHWMVSFSNRWLIAE